MSKTSASSPRFQLILIKPSHYDNDGYVVQWLRSTMPSNSLAAVYSLALGAAERQLLGPDLPIDVMAMDETKPAYAPRDRAPQAQWRSRTRRHRRRAVERVSPRVDIARPLRAAGVQVMIGGFHVSGCLSMLRLPDDIKEAQSSGAPMRRGRGRPRRGARRRAREAPSTIT
jgi:hypothetical protein